MITRLTSQNEVLELGKPCSKCCTSEVVCCKFGSGMVLAQEVSKLATSLNMTEQEFIKNYLDETQRFNTKLFQFKQIKNGKPYGPCIFLSEDNKCKIHEIKPLHCRVGNCGNEYGEQLSLWFMTNKLVNANDPQSIREYAIYLKTHPTLKGAQLKDYIKDEETLKKILAYEILR